MVGFLSVVSADLHCQVVFAWFMAQLLVLGMMDLFVSGKLGRSVVALIAAATGTLSPSTIWHRLQLPLCRIFLHPAASIPCAFLVCLRRPQVLRYNSCADRCRRPSPGSLQLRLSTLCRFDNVCHILEAVRTYMRSRNEVQFRASGCTVLVECSGHSRLPFRHKMPQPTFFRLVVLPTTSNVRHSQRSCNEPVFSVGPTHHRSRHS